MANDITILVGIAITFILIGTLLPFIQEDLSLDQYQGMNYTNVSSGISQTDIGSTVTGYWRVLSIISSIAAMFFWTFGAIPWYIDLAVFVPMRLAFITIVARNIWIGGGG